MADDPIQDPAAQPPYRDIAKQHAAGWLDVASAADVGAWVANAVTGALGDILGIILRLGAKSGAILVRSLTKGEDKAQSEFNDLAAAAVSDLFGVSASPGDMGRGNRGGRAAVANDVGEMLFRAFSAEAGASAAGELAPSDVPAKKFLATMTQLALEGWLEGWIAEACTAGFLKEFGELDDIISHVLGLGRASASVHGPLVRHMIVTPLDWKIQLAHRPQLMGTSLAVREFLRGKLTREQLDDELGRQGWAPRRIDALINETRQHFTTSEIKALRQAHELDDALAADQLRLTGWDEATTTALLASWRLDRLNEYADREVSAGISAFVDHRIDNSDLNGILAEAIKDDEIRLSAKHYAELLERTTKKRLSHGDVKDAVSRGILSRIDYRRWLEAEGYETDAALTLELLLDAEIHGQIEKEKTRAETEAARAAEKAAADAEKKRKAEELAAKNARTYPGLADFQRAVVRGILPIEAYTARLAELKYAAADIATLEELVQGDRDKYLADQEKRAAADGALKAKSISLSDLEHAALRGIISDDDYRRRLEAERVTPEDAAILVALLQGTRADREAAAAKHADAEARLGQRDISLGQAEKAVRQGLWSAEQYRALLTTNGFDAEEAALLVASLQQDMADAAADAQRREVVNQKAALRGIGLAQLERAVKLGVRTVDDYAAQLIRLEVSPEDQTTLVGILRAELAQAEAARAKRAAPGTPRETPGLSRGDVEKAVRAGLATVLDYRVFLTDAGYGADDADLLVGLLALEVQQLDEARRLRGSGGPGTSGPGLTRADREKAVRAGLSTVGDYRAWLHDVGYGDDDADTLAALLAQEVDRLEQARARRAELDAQSATRALSRGDLEKAVKAGLSTLDEYFAFLQAQGYDYGDAVLLYTLLQEELEQQAGGSDDVG